MLARQQVISKPIQIELHKDPTLPTVEHDSGQIHQVLLNLLLNAVQAIETSGTVRVELSTLEGNAAISVTDTGRGIAPEHFPISSGRSTRRKGTGRGWGSRWRGGSLRNITGGSRLQAKSGKARNSC